jgi:phosphonate transport system substrate-binding protein
MVARLALFLCLVAAIVYSGNAYWQTRAADENRTVTEASAVRAMGLVSADAKHLSAGFTDSQGTLLADPPTDPSKLVDPATLVLAHLDETDADTAIVDWVPFVDHLAKVTGKKVELLTVDNGPAAIDRIKSGQINLIALHAADVPFLVNNAGYQPVGVVANDSGATGNRMDLLVRSGSPINSPADLKGKTLTCTGPLSIVGYRAAVALLMQNQGLRPNVDYYICWSLGQTSSIKGVADGTYEVAAVSDEKLHSALEKGTVKESSYHMIYQSDVFPRTAIGYFYNLKPDLAAKVRDAVLTYKPVATGEGKPMHFAPVDYKKDFALVRTIDDRFDPRLENKAKRPEDMATPN